MCVTFRRTSGDIYGVEVGHDLISRVTDAVIDDVRAWQQRPLEDVYPVIFLDASCSRSARAGPWGAAPAISRWRHRRWGP